MRPLSGKYRARVGWRGPPREKISVATGPMRPVVATGAALGVRRVAVRVRGWPAPPHAVGLGPPGPRAPRLAPAPGPGPRHRRPPRVEVGLELEGVEPLGKRVPLGQYLARVVAELADGLLRRRQRRAHGGNRGGNLPRRVDKRPARRRPRDRDAGRVIAFDGRRLEEPRPHAVAKAGDDDLPLRLPDVLVQPAARHAATREIELREIARNVLVRDARAGGDRLQAEPHHVGVALDAGRVRELDLAARRALLH